jgi:hypothetical protein
LDSRLQLLQDQQEHGCKLIQRQQQQVRHSNQPGRATAAPT